MLDFLLTFVVLCVIFGVVHYLVSKAPMIPEPYKEWATWGVLFVFVLVLIGLLTGSIPLPRWPVVK